MQEYGHGFDCSGHLETRDAIEHVRSGTRALVGRNAVPSEL